MVEPAGAVDLEGAGREKSAVLGSGWQRALVEKPALARHPGGVALERFAGGLVDDRADIGREQCRVADRQLRHGARQHRQQMIGDVGLDIEQAQRRAALPGALEGGGQHVDDDLLGQCRGIDDHRVLAAGLGDQRHDRTGTPGEFEVDQPRGFGRSGKGDAGDPADRRPRERRPPRRFRAADAARRRGCRPHATAAPRRRRSAGSARRAWRQRHCRRRVRLRSGR